MKNIKVLNIRIDCLIKDELKEKLEQSFLDRKKVKIGKINTEFLLRAKSSKEFSDTINDFDLNIADGSGVLWAAKYLSLPLTQTPIIRQIQAVWQAIYVGVSLIFYPKYCHSPIPERFPGMEAFYLMLNVAAKTQTPVYFFGAEDNVLSIATEKIKKELPELNIAGYHEGYHYGSKDMIEKINQSEAKLLIVAQGSPKQEYWIRDNINKLTSVKVAVGEGGTFDYIAGENKRAPKWMRKIGMEWLWRLFMNKNKTGQPDIRDNGRLKRVWNAVPVFIYNTIKFKLENND